MTRTRKRAERVGRTLTLSPRSEALLSDWSERSGIARGRIVDMALACLAPCERCEGRGTLDGPHGPDTEACEECSGFKLIPCEAVKFS